MSRAPSDKDLEIILALNDTPLNRAMERARSELRRTISEMERDTQLAVGQIRNRTMREMGLDPWAERAVSARHEMELYQRQRWGVGAGGMGQDLVAPGRMSRWDAQAAAIERSELSMRQFTRSLAAVEVGAAGVSVAISLWRGNIAEAQRKLEELPLAIGHAAKVGRELGEIIAEWWTPKVFAAGIRGQGPRARELAGESAEVLAEQAESRMRQLADEFRRSARMAGMSPEQREALVIRERYQANLKRIEGMIQGGVSSEAVEAARQAALKQYDQESWALTRRQTDRLHQEAERNEQHRQAERKREEDDQRRKLDEQRHWAAEYEAASSEILQRRLERLGFGLEAEHERIRQSYRQRIRDAREAGQEQLALRYEQLRDAEIYGARAPAMGVPFQVINTRYVDPGGLALGGQRERTLQDIKNLNEGQLNELKRLVTLMTEGN